LRAGPPLHAPSFEDWWARTTALAAPLAELLASLPADATQTLRARVQEATSGYRTPVGGLEFPGLTLLATARRAGA